jgi:hypothetical protein
MARTSRITAKVPPAYLPVRILTSPTNELLTLLLADTVTDLGVVSRELGLPAAMYERLRRALDRLAFAQRALESVRRMASKAAAEEETRGTCGA